MILLILSWETKTSIENSGDWSLRRKDKGEDKFIEASYSLPSEVGEARYVKTSKLDRKGKQLRLKIT